MCCALLCDEAQSCFQYLRVFSFELCVQLLDTTIDVVPCLPLVLRKPQLHRPLPMPIGGFFCLPSPSVGVCAVDPFLQLWSCALQGALHTLRLVPDGFLAIYLCLILRSQGNLSHMTRDNFCQVFFSVCSLWYTFTLFVRDSNNPKSKMRENDSHA